MNQDYVNITPHDLLESLRQLTIDVDRDGYTDRHGVIVEPTNLGIEPFIIDDAKAFLHVDSRGYPAVGLSYIDSTPHKVSQNAGLELLTFVILIAVESTTSENDTVRKAQSLLYHLQSAIHGRVTEIGRPWQWAGHGLVPDDGADAAIVLQQTWQVLHGFNGYSGN